MWCGLCGVGCVLCGQTSIAKAVGSIPTGGVFWLFTLKMPELNALTFELLLKIALFGFFGFGLLLKITLFGLFGFGLLLKINKNAKHPLGIIVKESQYNKKKVNLFSL